MKKYILDLKVVSNERFASGHSLLKLTDESKALPEILPGQFVQVRACAEGGLPLLRRPISVNFVDREKNELWLLVHNVGVGTAYICSLNPGDTVNVVLPLGNGFTIPARTACGRGSWHGSVALFGQGIAEARCGTYFPAWRTFCQGHSAT